MRELRLPEQLPASDDLRSASVDFVATLPDRPPVPRHLDPASAIAYRTPIQEHVGSADGKAAGVLTLLGLMFTVLARMGGTLSDVMATRSPTRWIILTLLVGFAAAAIATVVQMFRTISPRFPTAEPSLAFFGDIARLDRDEYVRRVTSLSPEQALQQMVSYNHTSARILVLKFRQLNMGLNAFKLAVIWWLPLAVYLVARSL